MAAGKAALSSLSLTLVGPGRVGSSLASWIVSRGGNLTRVVSRDPGNAYRLTSRLGGRVALINELDSSADDLLLIAVSDAALEAVTQALAQRPQASVALHTSGRESAAALAALQPGGTDVGSLHPLMAFPTVVDDPATAAGVVFGIDGDRAAQDLAKSLVAAWSGHCVEIPAEARHLYHLGATMSAGGVVTLVASAASLAQSLGLDPMVAQGYLRLAQGALDRAARCPSLGQAITGPLARGDIEGFAGQIRALRAIDASLADFVERLSEQTLSVCGGPRHRGDGPGAGGRS